MNMRTHTNSHLAFERARAVIPGGVNSPARAFGAVGGEPLFIVRGDGPFLIDVDDNRYLDYIGSWGPLILGHAHPRVVAAAIEAVQKGSSYGAPCERETELAELIREAMPSVEMVRMVSSGTEAAMERDSARAATRAGTGSSNSQAATTAMSMRSWSPPVRALSRWGFPPVPVFPEDAPQIRWCCATTMSPRSGKSFGRKARKSRQ